VKPRSLRVRLLLTAAVAIFIALAAAWVVMTLLFERHIERRVHADLVRDGMQLAANLSIGPDGAPLLSREPGDVRFTEPASGLYWQVTTLRGDLRSRSLWDQKLPASDLARARDWSTRLSRSSFCWSSASSSRIAMDLKCCCSSAPRTSRCTRRGASSELSWHCSCCCCGRFSPRPPGLRSRWACGRSLACAMKSLR
jgi:hypothetical protein